MIEFRHRAMACDFVVLIRDGHAGADRALTALDGLNAIERRLTVYLPDSEISRINAAGADVDVRVSPETARLLDHAVELSRRTGGAFDVTAGPLVDAWGFTTRQGRKPTRDEINAALACVGSQALRVDVAASTVRLGKPGMRLNLGGIGKGHAIDWLAGQLRNAGITDFLIHAGQSSVLASGDQWSPAQWVDCGGSPDEPPPTGWLVGVAHPTKPGRRLAGLWLNHQALSTSGSGKQFFHHRGKRYGHVIDPRSGTPAGDLLSLTLLTDSAVDADALATGLFVLGRGDAERVAIDVGASLLMVAAGKRQDDVEITEVGPVTWAERP